MLFERNFVNILQLGLGFLLVFTAYQTCGNIQQFVVSSIYHDRNSTGNYSGPPIADNSGYVSSAIVYALFTASNFVAAPIVDLIGQKWSMVIGAFFYLLYLTSFLYLTTVFLYVCSALLGFGASIIWVGQGTYLANNSNDVTASRNSGLFWAMFQFSLFVGGLIAFFTFNTDLSANAYLDKSVIYEVYICFSVLAAVGIIVLVFLRKPGVDPTKPVAVQKEKVNMLSNFAGTFVRMVKLMLTLPQIFLAFVFVFTGLEQGFWGGVYGTSLGNTLNFYSHKQLVALNGIFVGIGETIGGALFGIFGKQVNRFGRIPVVFLGLISNMVAFVLIFINIPFEATVVETSGSAYITSNEYLAMFCSVLLGFADACWNTQIYSLLSTYYVKDSAPAFGLYKFFQAAATCASYFYSGDGKLHLQWQLLILAIFCPIAAFCFCNAQWVMNRRVVQQPVVQEHQKFSPVAATDQPRSPAYESVMDEKNERF